MIPAYNKEAYEFGPPSSTPARTNSLENQVQRMQQQMQEMAKEIDYLNRERQRMKADIQHLTSMLK